MMIEIHWYTLLGAYILDLLLGDPISWPHPVVWMGRAINRLEPVFRRWIRAPFPSGLVFALSLIAGVWMMGTVILGLAFMLNPFLGEVVQVILLFFCLSGRTLDRAAERVGNALKNRGLDAARFEVSMIVGRDVTRLDETGVVKASVETVAENFVDGFVSPLFFALIGGVPLALTYKMVNTLDSMVGYQNPAYILFGRASARIDDIANCIPARLSVLLIFPAAAVLGGLRAGFGALKTAVLEGRQHKSPNAGYPEAAFAGALKVRLGGPNVYHKILVEKPFIGKSFREPGPDAIKKACDLMLLACFFTVISALVISSWV